MVGVVALFTYGFATADAAFARAFGGAGVPLVALSDYAALVEVATACGLVADADRAALDAWRRDPAAWGR